MNRLGGGCALEVARQTPGRVVLAERDGAIHLGRNAEILRSNDDGRTWTRVSALPRSPLRRAAEGSRLACRLLRHEIRALVRLSDGGYVAASRDGVFFGRPGDSRLAPSAVEGSPYLSPMRITLGPGDRVLWGEYVGRRPTRTIRIFASRDAGRSFQAVHTFELGSVFHVHNILWDARLDHYWVLAGDHGAEPGIGRLSADLERFEWLVKGEQRYRAVAAFDLGDRLVYATDTELESNGLISLDKETGRAERLRDFDGSCIYACRFGALYALSTTVEPSAVNRSEWATLWLSRDGERWWPGYRARKDRWSPRYFQFGSIVLPAGESDREVVFFSGQAVESLDGVTAVALPSASDAARAEA